MKTINKGILSVILIIFLMVNLESFAQVGIGITTPNGNSLLDVTSTTKGFLPPRLTTAERNTLGTTLLTTPEATEAGMLVFDTTLNAYYYWDGTAWVLIASSGSGYVDLTSMQTIGGMKTFTNNITPTGRIMVPMGEISYFNTTLGHTIDIPVTSDGTTNMVPVNPPTVLSGSLYEFDNGGANDGTLRYTGETTKMFHMAITVSGTPEVPTNVFVFAVYLDGVPQPASKVLGSSSGTQFSSLHIMLMLQKNNKVQLYIGNISANRDCTVTRLKLFARGL